MFNAKELIRKSQSLQESRSNFETVWQNVAEIFNPIKSNVIVDRTAGDKSDYEKLYESAPINYVKQLKSIIIGVVFNRSIKPISIKAGVEELNEDEEIKNWIADFTDMTLKTMFNPNTNFERAFSEAMNDDIVFGTIATFIEKGKKSPLKYYTLHIKDILLAENDEGDADYIVIKYKYSARQIEQKWGNNSNATIHEKITKCLNDEPFKEFDLQLHIFPREERNKNKSDKLNKEIAGVWVDVENQAIIEEIGWDTMPVAIGRSEKATNEDYGTSRAMIALADASQINTMSKQVNDATERSLNPPLNVNATYTKRISLRAGALNRPDLKSLQVGRAAIEPITSIGNIPLTQDLIMRKEQNIKEIFFLDKLKIMDDPRATATQTLELKAEMFRIMGDFISGVVSYLEQTLNRTFDLLFNQIYQQNINTGKFDLIPNNGLFFKPLPEALINNPDLIITYQNPITQSQRLNESASIEKLVTSIANLAQVKPEVLDLLDSDKIARKYSDILGVDPELIKDALLVKKERLQRQQQMEQQNALEQEQQAVQTASMAKQSKLI